MTNALLQGLADDRELTALVDRLGRWLDDRRWAEASEIFTADATAETPGGTARGRDALVAQASHNHDESVTQHVITNCIVDVDGDRATIGANLLVSFAGPGALSEPRFQMGERYRFEARRTPEGWRLSAVRTRPLWRSAQPAVALRR